MEIVLETLFDDQRIHLTEKVLRPLACGQPFILAATTGSLEYLKSYGFKTFDSLWDESYDQLEGPERWQAIRKIIDLIMQMDTESRRGLILESNKIAQQNRQHLAKIIKLNDT